MGSTRAMTNLSELPEQTVNNDSGVRHTPVVEWLLNEGYTAPDSTKLIEGFAERLVGGGISLSRMLVFVHSLHPQVVGVRYTWQRKTEQVETWSVPYSIAQTTSIGRTNALSCLIETLAMRFGLMKSAVPALL